MELRTYGTRNVFLAQPGRYHEQLAATAMTPQQAEEWAVHDYDDVFGDTWGEHPDLDKLCALQERLDELHNDTERAAYTAFCDHEGLDDVTVEQFHEAYVGQFDSWADFAENYVDESGLLHGVPDALSRYFDYESYGRDIRLNGDAFEVSGFYFWSR